MALIHCQECQRQISDKAAICPHCGAPLSAATEPDRPITVYNPRQDRFLTRNRGCLESLVWLFIVLLLLALILGR